MKPHPPSILFSSALIPLYREYKATIKRRILSDKGILPFVSPLNPAEQAWVIPLVERMAEVVEREELLLQRRPHDEERLRRVILARDYKDLFDMVLEQQQVCNPALILLPLFRERFDLLLMERPRDRKRIQLEKRREKAKKGPVIMLKPEPSCFLYRPPTPPTSQERRSKVA